MSPHTYLDLLNRITLLITHQGPRTSIQPGERLAISLKFLAWCMPVFLKQVVHSFAKIQNEQSTKRPLRTVHVTLYKNTVSTCLRV